MSPTVRRIFGPDGKGLVLTAKPMPGSTIKFVVEGKCDNSKLLTRRVQIVKFVEETF